MQNAKIKMQNDISKFKMNYVTVIFINDQIFLYSDKS